MKISRREFLIASTFAGAGAVLIRNWPSPAASDRVRIAVIGLGGRGMRHVAAYGSVPAVEVVALCDKDERRVRAGAKVVADSGITRPAEYTDWRRLFERKDIDAVSIATAHRSQTEIALAAVVAGKDLLLDAPPRSLPELSRLRDAAQTGRRMVGQVYGAQFAGAADARLEIGPHTLEKIDVARVHRNVSDIDAFGEADVEGVYESFVSSAVEEFDYARGVLDANTLRSASCVTIRGARGGEVVRVGIRYEFETVKGLKNIELDTITVQDSVRSFVGMPAAGTYGPTERVGFINFGGAGSAFTVHLGNGDGFERDSALSAWQNFIACIRSRQAADLMSPLAEFTASLEMLELAKVSIESGRVTVFPRNESIRVRQP